MGTCRNSDRTTALRALLGASPGAEDTHTLTTRAWPGDGLRVITSKPPLTAEATCKTGSSLGQN